MILNKDIRIKTDRLILQPVEDLYIDDINTCFTAEVTRYMPFNPHGDRNDILVFVEESKKLLLKNTDLVMVALDDDNNFMGCCGIHSITEESVELGLWLKKDAQGIGLGTEIIVSLIEFLESNFTFKYIVYPVDQENIASRRIPEKLGFIPFKKYQKNKSPSSFLNIIEYRKQYSV
ncbi:GNAT family N-acetyltransferase [Chryseobacterium sp. WG14]|uniref:GNAT family N-acetyltransferase n=1 Tax=unclassified Chryseobacterium TaxID=2593645 RepID=UPI00211E1629|nr:MULTISPECIES: GNAT family N-acetyltransferase [unclassified Chryseobacterium]MCQ9637105.1 GNAT family N-acetyltransferase [Chryseobacterium sp. WG23]MCQ9641921.1 GNAT family N-acetyltransferase [Chryseobacterium sp. WG14]